MQASEIKKGIHWVGAIDWSMRSFHGYETGRGSSYNAYLILDEKITLIDTVKEPFRDELISRISSVIDPAKIDIIVSNHVEPDHSGSIPEMMKLCPKAEIYTSDPNGFKGLTAHYGKLPYHGVKAGDTLSLGKRTLKFVPTPMLHWPDSMVTYCPEEKILFSNDAFGQHLAASKLFDDEVDFAVLMEEPGTDSLESARGPRHRDDRHGARQTLALPYPRYPRRLPEVEYGRAGRQGGRRLRLHVAFDGKDGARHRRSLRRKGTAHAVL